MFGLAYVRKITIFNAIRRIEVCILLQIIKAFKNFVCNGIESFIIFLILKFKSIFPTAWQMINSRESRQKVFNDVIFKNK